MPAQAVDKRSCDPLLGSPLRGRRKVLRPRRAMRRDAATPRPFAAALDRERTTGGTTKSRARGSRDHDRYGNQSAQSGRHVDRGAGGADRAGGGKAARHTRAASGPAAGLFRLSPAFDRPERVEARTGRGSRARIPRMARHGKISAPAPRPPASAAEGAARVRQAAVDLYDRHDGQGVDWSAIAETLFRAAFDVLDQLPDGEGKRRIARRVHAGAYDRAAGNQEGQGSDGRAPAQKPAGASPGKPARPSPPR